MPATTPVLSPTSATPLNGPFANLLSASGVTSPGDLARSHPEKLLRWMEEVNAEQRLVRKMPTLDVVRSWVQQAQAYGAAA